MLYYNILSDNEEACDLEASHQKKYGTRVHLECVVKIPFTETAKNRRNRFKEAVLPLVSCKPR